MKILAVRYSYLVRVKMLIGGARAAGRQGGDMAGVWWCRCAGSSCAARASGQSPSVASRTRRHRWSLTTTAVSRCAWTPSRAAASATPAAISTLPCTCRRTLRRRRAARYATRLHALASLARARFSSSAWSRSPRRRLCSQSLFY